jgi:cytochrome c biogenesis protein CcmG/thiol:disulfide interchange protein DsbE
VLPRSAGFVLAIPLAFAVVYFAMFALEERAGPLSKPQERRYAEDFTLHTLDGEKWTLSAQRGNVVVLNFRGTACSPCLREMPALVKTASRFRTRGLRTLGICVDDNEQAEETLQTIRYAVERLHILFPVLWYHPISDRGQSGIRFPVAVDSVPITVLIDRAGRVARTYCGAVTELLLQKDIERLLHES